MSIDDGIHVSQIMMPAVEDIDIIQAIAISPHLPVTMLGQVC